MTNEEAIEKLKRDIHNAKVTHHLSEHYEMAINALKQQPCEDCINRADARHLIAEVNIKTLGCISTKAFKALYNGIDELPSATPQPKIGHWIIIDDCERFIAKCSECGRIEDSRMISKYPYCHCGAKMEVEE